MLRKNTCWTLTTSDNSPLICFLIDNRADLVSIQLPHYSDLVVDVSDEGESLVGLVLDGGDVVEGVQEGDAGVSLATALSVDLKARPYLADA